MEKIDNLLPDQPESVSEAFWDRWIKADSFGRVALVQKLALPSRMVQPESLYRYHAATLLNSYLEDLVKFVEDSIQERMEADGVADYWRYLGC